MKQSTQIVLVWCSLLFTTILSAQNVLSDAIFLSKYCQPDDVRAILTGEALELNEDEEPVLKANVAAVLAPYCGVAPEALTQAVINNTFMEAKNPYMRIGFTSMSGVQKGMKLEMQPNGPAASGNPVSFIADGIARFLVKRTKDELALAFFSDFKQKLENDKGFFSRFFKNTREILKVMDTEVYQFQIYLEAMRSAFSADLRVLPGNLGSYLRDNPEKNLNAVNQAMAIDLFQVIQMHLDGAANYDLLQYLASDTDAEIQIKAVTNDSLTNLATGLHLVNLISTSLYEPDEGKWFKGRDIKTALNNPVTMRLYLGLLWHQAKTSGKVFKNGVSLQDMVAKAAVTPALIQNWQQELVKFGRDADELDEVQKTLRFEKDKTSLSDNFSRTLHTFIRILETANTFNTLLNPGTEDVIGSEYFQLFQQVGGLHFNVRQKHYSAAVGNMVFVLQQLLNNKDFKGKKDLLKYGMFIAAVAEAENATEVQNAIELFALPPGSSKAKKAPNTFALALNAYPGGHASSETFKLASGVGDRQTSGAYGLTAPVGISVNWGQRWGIKKGEPKYGSMGFFFPVLDVGAVFAYRIQDGSQENLPPMEWKNIVAPGAYFVVSPPLGKWPLTFGLGGQAGPLLRKVEDNGQYVNRDVVGYRLGGFLTFDIPINYLGLKSKDAGKK